MYTAFYGLSGDPFAPDPDPRYFFESPGHKRALAYLRYGLGHGEGTVIITGARGMGKTTLIRRLARQLRARDLVPASLLVPPGGLPRLTQVVAEQFGLALGDLPADRAHAALRGHLLSLRQAGMRACLVLDEAHHLDRDGLDELTALLESRAGARLLVPGLLLAQAEFRDTLRAPERRPLRHCTSVAYQLNPLGLEETIAYIEHRLRLAGWNDDPVFLPLAYLEVFFLSMGIPGRVNQLCSEVLLHAAEQGLHEVKAETVATASTRLPAEPPEEAGRPW
jgi:type II secretory pathway predicted ATPase ExeA